MSVILATDESIRTPALSVQELIARTGPCKKVAIALLGGMAPNHSPLTQPFPMVSWLTDLNEFDAVFYLVGPHCHRYSRSDAPTAEEPPLRDEDFADEEGHTVPSYDEMMDEQKAMLGELVAAFPEGSLTKFCLFGYSVGGKFLLRFWPSMKTTLVARQPQAELLCLIVAAGFLITAAGDDWLRGTLTLELMKKNDRRFSMLARQHGRGLPLVLKSLRKLLWGPSECMKPGEKFLYSSTLEERELIQQDSAVTIIMSELDRFYPPSTLWLPDDPVQPPPLGFDLSQASEHAPLEEIRTVLDAQLENYRAATAKTSGARLQFSKGDHIPMASGIYQNLTRELVVRIIRESYSDTRSAPSSEVSPSSAASSSSSSSSSTSPRSRF